MSKLTINSNIYNYPDPGTEQGWGTDATDWASDVTDILNSLTGNGYISESTVNLNQSGTLVDIPALVFNSLLTKSAAVKYRIWVKFSGISDVDLIEDGVLNISYNDETGVWSLSREFVGNDSKVYIEFSGTTQGQLQYKTGSYTGTFSTIEMKFKTASVFGV